MSVAVLGAGALSVYLTVETLRHRQNLQRVPLRIAVTGTRGKSSVVRLLAAVLCQSGSVVLAKTTGTEPQLILPNGEEERIRRRGGPSIIEQKKVMRRAAREKVDTLVVELMSIHAENHRVESQRLIRPQILILTNTRPDHFEGQGHAEEVAAVLAEDIGPGMDVFLPAPLLDGVIAQKCSAVGAVPHAVQGKLDDDFGVENQRLVRAVTAFLGVNAETVNRGLNAAASDPGVAALWEIHRHGKTVYFANGFAANEPQSTMMLIEAAQKQCPSPLLPMGLLALRGDRGDRSAQWAAFLRTHRLFDPCFVAGGHARAFVRQVKHATRLRSASPEALTHRLICEAADGQVIVGLGNWMGTGSALVEYWNAIGKRLS